MGEVQIKKKLSYTALSTFDHCQFQYYLKYIDKNYPKQSTLALEIGTIAHKVKQLVSLDLMACRKPDYEQYVQYLWEGYEGIDKASGLPEKIRGVNELACAYPHDFYTEDASGVSYKDKVKLFISHLQDEENDFDNWYTIGVEVPFEFEYEGFTFCGFIDKVMMNYKGQIAIVDYKTSRKTFSDSDIKTPLQMLIYNIAARHLYPSVEVTTQYYDFVFLGVQQEAGSVGWIKRGETKLHNLLAKLKMNESTGIWEAKPSPLCHYCDYCKTKENPESNLAKLCPYYSLWLPEDKTFNVAKRWDGRKAEIIVNEAKNGNKKFVW